MDLPYDAGDERQVKTRKTVAQLARERELEELRVILQTKGGRYLIWRQLEKCGLFQQQPISDPLQLAAAADRQNYGKWLLAEALTAMPDVYQLMMVEAADRSKGK